MSFKNASAIITSLILACVVWSPLARASVYNQMTELAFTTPIEIPGQILPAGTYWFVLKADDSNRDIVQIFNANRSKLEATLLTIPAYRQQWTSRTELTFAERPQVKPEALLEWFFPGEQTGHEFLYSKRHEAEFARDTKQDALAHPMNLAANTVPPPATIAR